jgi:putative endonuclease
MYTVYILYSNQFDKIYIGYTGNLSERLLSHNELAKKGWTIKYRPWALVYSEEFETKEEAMIREKQLKSGKGREWIWSEVITKGKQSGLISA